MISIIIPTLNEERAIRKSITQFREKFTLPHEIIVSDGGSTDGTVAIAKELADIVTVWAGPGRQTIAGGRNAGAKIARGDILVYMDTDCTIPNPNEFFTKTLKYFTDNPKLNALTTNINVQPELATFLDNLIFGFANVYNRFCNNITHTGGARGEFQMIRKTGFEKVGGFREDLVAREDYDMFIRLAKIGDVYFEPTLQVYETGRRARKVGWPRLLTSWILNIIWYNFSGKSYSKEWKEVR